MTTADRITNGLSQPEQRDGPSGEELVRGLSLGARQAEGPLAVFPLFAKRNDGAGEAGALRRHLQATSRCGRPLAQAMPSSRR
jgi:hypothetical protein